MATDKKSVECKKKTNYELLSKSFLIKLGT